MGERGYRISGRERDIGSVGERDIGSVGERGYRISGGEGI